MYNYNTEMGKYEHVIEGFLIKKLYKISCNLLNIIIFTILISLLLSSFKWINHH